MQFFRHFVEFFDSEDMLASVVFEVSESESVIVKIEIEFFFRTLRSILT